MSDFPGVNGENALPNAAQDTQGLASSYTQSDAMQDPVLSRLERQEQLIARQDEQLAELRRQLQSQDARLLNRMAKRMQEDEAATRRSGEIEGADEKTIEAKIRKARQDILVSMPLNEVEKLNSQGVSARAQQAEPASTLDAHAAQLREYLSSLGLQETDLGPQGLSMYVGKPLGSPESKQFARAVAKALETREQAARDYALHMQRQSDANDLRDEMQTSGGLGGFGSYGSQTSGASTARNNALRLIQQEKEKYRGTGRAGEWLSRKEQLLQQYGLPPDTTV